ncbi:hypothetical protein AJ80_04279 [Polytolypa hystricis UAMH7299]|uniref:Uncharacterized protein n=1 Tax=Polytolypa hystricis (strain UAMH7299) TaxID=1447883 RepID=A0A2B7YDK0_POLH7|nr:hypothetical protein AJ80_04279 [Polytolypa hystricis UAMH7299]
MSSRVAIQPGLRSLMRTRPTEFVLVHAHHNGRFAFQQCRFQTTGRQMPRVLEPSIWTSIIPKFIRNGEWRSSSKEPRKSRGYNPATFYIVMATLIGSQSIHMIILKKEYGNFTRSTDAKIQLLKEVIDKLQKGEDIDVKKLLGTGDQAKEREWEEVLKELEQEESLWHSRAKKQQDTPEPDQRGDNTAPDSGDNATAGESTSVSSHSELTSKDKPARKPFSVY